MCLVGSPPIVLCIYSPGENGADFLSSFAPPRSTCTSEWMPPPAKLKVVILRKEGDRLTILGGPFLSGRGLGNMIIPPLSLMCFGKTSVCSDSYIYF